MAHGSDQLSAPLATGQPLRLAMLPASTRACDLAQTLHTSKGQRKASGPFAVLLVVIQFSKIAPRRSHRPKPTWPKSISTSTAYESAIPAKSLRKTPRKPLSIPTAKRREPHFLHHPSQHRQDLFTAPLQKIPHIYLILILNNTTIPTNPYLLPLLSHSPHCLTITSNL